MIPLTLRSPHLCASARDIRWCHSHSLCNRSQKWLLGVRLRCGTRAGLGGDIMVRSVDSVLDGDITVWNVGDLNVGIPWCYHCKIL